MMKLVIDSNMLRSDLLREFLSKSTDHKAVLTEFVMREAYKGKSVLTVTESMAVLVEYPTQVLILKAGGALRSVTGETEGLQERLIDRGATESFPAFAHALARAKSGDSKVIERIKEVGQQFNAHFDRLVQESPALRDAMRTIWDQATPEERRLLREGEPMPLDLQRLFRDLLQDVILAGLRSENFELKVSSERELANTPVFRSFAAVLLMSLMKHAKGELHERRAEKMGNDFVDMSIVACATYFDGVLTNDNNVGKMLYETGDLLRSMFGADVQCLADMLSRSA